MTLSDLLKVTPGYVTVHAHSATFAIAASAGSLEAEKAPILEKQVKSVIPLESYHIEVILEDTNYEI